MKTTKGCAQPTEANMVRSVWNQNYWGRIVIVECCPSEHLRGFKPEQQFTNINAKTVHVRKGAELLPQHKVHWDQDCFAQTGPLSEVVIWSLSESRSQVQRQAREFLPPLDLSQG